MYVQCRDICRDYGMLRLFYYLQKCWENYRSANRELWNEWHSIWIWLRLCPVSISCVPLTDINEVSILYPFYLRGEYLAYCVYFLFCAHGVWCMVNSSCKLICLGGSEVKRQNASYGSRGLRWPVDDNGPAAWRRCPRRKKEIWVLWKTDCVLVVQRDEYLCILNYWQRTVEIRIRIRI